MSELPIRRLRRASRRPRPTPSVRPDAVTELLAELTTVDPTEAAALREFLTVASAPAAVGELAGEDAALAAFRAAAPLPAVQEARRTPRNLARLLTVKAAALTVAITATGGVALAATTGALPVPSTGITHRPTTVTVTPTPRAGDPDRTDRGGAAGHGVLGADPTGGPTAAPVSAPTTAPGNGLHLGWCKGVGNPHNTPANCGTTTTTGGTGQTTSSTGQTTSTTGNVNGSGKTPPGWCKPNNPHYDPTTCGTTGNGNGHGNGSGNGNG